MQRERRQIQRTIREVREPLFRMPHAPGCRSRTMTARGKAALCAVFCVAACRETPRSDDVPVAPPEPPPVASPCAPLICTPFATSEQALSFVLDLRPRVIAFGESHALRGGADVMTATERFGADYLPLLRDRGASTLVV